MSVNTPTLTVFFQVVQAEKKKDKEEEADKDNESMKEKVAEVDPEQEKEDEKESAEVIKKDKLAEEKVKSPRTPRQPKSIQIRVSLLDNTLYECELDVRTHTHSVTLS